MDSIEMSNDINFIVQSLGQNNFIFFKKIDDKWKKYFIGSSGEVYNKEIEDWERIYYCIDKENIKCFGVNNGID